MGQRGQTGSDLGFDHPWLERLIRLFEEDLGHVLDAAALVVATVAPARDGLHPASAVRVGANRHRRYGDTVCVDGLDHRLICVASVAVAEHYDVLERRRPLRRSLLR